MKQAIKQQHAEYQVVPYPKIRLWQAAAYRSVRRKPMMHGLIDVDVTGARARIRERQATTGESLSFTAFLIVCLAKAVDEHKAAQAFRQGGDRLILFDDVDVWTPVEHDLAGQKQVVPTIIWVSQSQDLARDSPRDQGSADAGHDTRRESVAVAAALSLPALLLDLLLESAEGPADMEEERRDGEHYGSGHVCGRRRLGHPHPSPSPDGDGGGIDEKPGAVDGRIALREYLSLTVSFDHELVDGAPAARFTRRLKELIESGYGLDDSTVESEQAAAPGTFPRQAESFHPALP